VQAAKHTKKKRTKIQQWKKGKTTRHTRMCAQGSRRNPLYDNAELKEKKEDDGKSGQARKAMAMPTTRKHVGWR
jgi:hypothetical protein